MSKKVLTMGVGAWYTSKAVEREWLKTESGLEKSLKKALDKDE